MARKKGKGKCVTCIYQKYGCNFKGKPANMNNHMKDKEAALTHSALMDKTKQTLLDRVKEIENDMKTNDLIVSKEELDDKSTGNQDQVSDESTGNQDQMSEDCDHQNNHNSAVKAETIIVEFDERIVVKKNAKCFMHEPNEIRFLCDCAEEHLRHFKNHSMKHPSYKDFVTVSTTVLDNSVVVFKIDSYKTRKSHAINCPQGCPIYSEPFYTIDNSYGYRLRLQIYLNGYGEGKGQYMSCYVSILKGEHDHLLTWPTKDFRILVLLMAPDQRFIPQLCVCPEWTSNCHQSLANHRIGLEKSVEISKLENEYLRGDYFVASLHVVELDPESNPESNSSDELPTRSPNINAESPPSKDTSSNQEREKEEKKGNEEKEAGAEAEEDSFGDIEKTIETMLLVMRKVLQIFSDTQKKDYLTQQEQEFLDEIYLELFNGFSNLDHGANRNRSVSDVWDSLVKFELAVLSYYERKLERSRSSEYLIDRTTCYFEECTQQAIRYIDSCDSDDNSEHELNASKGVDFCCHRHESIKERIDDITHIYLEDFKHFLLLFTEKIQNSAKAFKAVRNMSSLFHFKCTGKPRKAKQTISDSSLSNFEDGNTASNSQKSRKEMHNMIDKFINNWFRKMEEQKSYIIEKKGSDPNNSETEITCRTEKTKCNKRKRNDQAEDEDKHEEEKLKTEDEEGIKDSPEEVENRANGEKKD